MNRSQLLRALASTVLLILLVASAAQGKARLGVSIAQFDDNFLMSVREAMVRRAAAADAVEIQFQDAQGDVGRQLSQVQNFIAQRVDAIVVIAVDTAATRAITRAASKAAIPLVYVNRHPEEQHLPAHVVVVGSDERLAGRLQMTELARLLQGRGNVAIMLGDLSNESTRGRTAGLKEIVARYPAIKIVEEQSANFDRLKAMDLMINWMVKGTRIDAVAANNDEMAIGASLAIHQIPLSGRKILVAGVDATSDAMAEIARGRLAVTVFQNARGQGERSIEDALRLVRGEPVEQYDWIPFELVTPQNYRNYVQR
ncbi:MAG: sugar ABC transporter substrate-binding protein [Gammaproteobacteria bacterium]|nr:MAG: sugar ABC transporter substrate-binding protein [Gammaproteobacteria bacterium]